MISNGKNLCENCFSPMTGGRCESCGAAEGEYVSDPMLLAVGSMLQNRYRIGGIIGKGGFGVTYIAFDTKLERRIAVKEYFPYGLASRNTRDSAVMTTGDAEVFKKGAEKFYNEAQLIAKFNNSESIVNVYDVFYENDTVYYVMEYISGQPLKSYVENVGKLDPGQAVYIAEKVTDALETVHGINVLHRDISPDNIMLCSDNKVKLIDFGAARQVVSESSQSLSVILTQGFAPLEQYQKKGKQGPWTDIYSLGASIYYGLTGVVIDDPMSRFEDDSAIQDNPNSIDDELWGIIKKAVSLKTTDRYQSASEMREALEAISIKPEKIIIPKETIKLKSPSELVSAMAAVPESKAAGNSKSAEVSEQSVEQMRTMPVDAALQMKTMPVSENWQVKTMPVNESSSDGGKDPDKKRNIIIIAVIAAVVLLLAIIIGVLTSGGSDDDDNDDTTTETTSSTTSSDETSEDDESDTSAEASETQKTEETKETEETTEKNETTEETSVPREPDRDADKETEAVMPPDNGPVPESVIIGGTEYSTDRKGTLDLSNKGLENKDIEGLKYMKDLSEIIISNNNISDLSVLSPLTGLEKITFHNNSVKDISFAKGMKKLKVFGANNNYISDLSILSEMTDMEELWLEDNLITDISPLENMPKLTAVDFKNNNIRDISALTGKQDIVRLYLSNCGLKSIDPLKKTTNITILDVSNNMLTDLTPVNGNVFSELYASNNDLNGNFDAVDGLMINGTLYLDGNGYDADADAFHEFLLRRTYGEFTYYI